jgi:hypothetical protein
MKDYDVIIVGAGIAGLYAAYKIKTLSPKMTFKILEASPRKWIGGRAGEMNFSGTSVVTGAGIGRKMKDKLLIELLKDLKLTYSEFPIHHRFSKQLQGGCDVKTIFEHLRSKHPSGSIGKTFKEYAEPILGKDGYSLFVICSGYSDYEKEDSYDTLYHYEFDDNFSDGVGLSISWPKLIDALVKNIGSQNIITSCRVTKLQEYLDSDYFELSCENGKKFISKKIILATTIDSLKKLLPKDPIYKDIGGQEFLRLYGKFSKDSIPLMQEAVPGYTIVQGPLQKIIPMNSKEGIYMIAYSDNKSAKQLKKYLKNTVENREYISRIIEKSLNIPRGEIKLVSILDAYWEIGTHYYKPLSKKFKSREEFIEEAQHPSDNILVIGEMVALNQGWVEGALDSVKRGLTKDWLKNA